MPRHARARTVICLAGVLVLGLGASGCTQGRWSPTGDAMASAAARGTLSPTQPQQFAQARPTHRTLVLADDGYSRLATSVNDSSNTTVTASADEAE